MHNLSIRLANISVVIHVISDFNNDFFYLSVCQLTTGSLKDAGDGRLPVVGGALGVSQQMDSYSENSINFLR